jgi:hypothetical protein
VWSILNVKSSIVTPISTVSTRTEDGVLAIEFRIDDKREIFLEVDLDNNNIECVMLTHIKDSREEFSN